MSNNLIKYGPYVCMYNIKPRIKFYMRLSFSPRYSGVCVKGEGDWGGKAEAGKVDGVFIDSEYIER